MLVCLLLHTLNPGLEGYGVVLPSLLQPFKRYYVRDTFLCRLRCFISVPGLVLEYSPKQLERHPTF